MYTQATDSPVLAGVRFVPLSARAYSAPADNSLTIATQNPH